MQFYNDILVVSPGWIPSIESFGLANIKVIDSDGFREGMKDISWGDGLRLCLVLAKLFEIDHLLSPNLSTILL
nr:hypothetical protein K4M19_00380 [Agrobacterium fabrum]